MARAFVALSAEAESGSSIKFGKLTLTARKANRKRPVKIPRRFETSFQFLILKFFAKFRRVFPRMIRRKTRAKREKVKIETPPIIKGEAEPDSEDEKKPVSGTTVVSSFVVPGIQGIEAALVPFPDSVRTRFVPGPEGEVFAIFAFCFLCLFVDFSSF